MKTSLTNDIKREFHRQSFHLALGLILGFAVGFGLINYFIIFLLFLIALVFAFLLAEGKKIPPFELFLRWTERPEEEDGLRGGGLIAFLLGSLIVSLFFSNMIAAAAIIVLGIGDSLSFFISLKIRIIKHPFGKKYLEAHILSAIVASLVAMVFVPFFPVLIAALIGLFIEGIDALYKWDFMDDNILVPIVVALILFLLI